MYFKAFFWYLLVSRKVKFIDEELFHMEQSGRRGGIVAIVKIIKKKDDPLCVRLSLGGSEAVGFYGVYRGPLEEVRRCARQVLEALDAQPGELPVAPDDGKEYA